VPLQTHLHPHPSDAACHGTLKRSRTAAPTNIDNISVSSADSSTPRPPRKRHEQQSAQLAAQIAADTPSSLNEISTVTSELHSGEALADHAFPTLQSSTAHHCVPGKSPSPKHYHTAESLPDHVADLYKARAIPSTEVVISSTTDTPDSDDEALSPTTWGDTPAPLRETPTLHQTRDAPAGYDSQDEESGPSDFPRFGWKRTTPRSIDRNQPVDTFSNQDMADMKRAADCFAVLGCDHLAFQLYITILKRRRWKLVTWEKPVPSLWDLIIRCAHAATNSAHVVIIRNIIREEMDRLSGHSGASSMYRFLLHMLLASISHRNPESQDADVNLNIRAARSYAGPYELHLFEYLPPEDRSLDLALYNELFCLYTEWCFSEWYPEWYPESSATLGATLIRSENRLKLDAYILERVPGLFEIRANGGAGNWCVRSCLRWCEDELHGLESRWRIHGGRIDIDHRDTLFTTLWQRWRLGSTAGATGDASQFLKTVKPFWIAKAQSTMGLNQTELLMITTRMIYDPGEACTEPLDPSHPSVTRILQRVVCMLRESDRQLGLRFLKHYLSLHNTAEWSHSGRQSRGWEAAAIRRVQETLGVVFPDLGASTGSSQGCASSSGSSVCLQAGSQLVGRQTKPFSPTLASSLSSIDLSSFNQVYVDVTERLRKFARGPPSVVTWDNASVISPRTSDLSASFRSMSISGRSSTRAKHSSPISGRALAQRTSAGLDHHGTLEEPIQEQDKGSKSGTTTNGEIWIENE
jgi:hypothetical protein